LISSRNKIVLWYGNEAYESSNGRNFVKINIEFEEPEEPVDTDGDGFADNVDNCLLTANTNLCLVTSSYLSRRVFNLSIENCLSDSADIECR